MAKRIIDGIEVETSSGNVFADLGLPDSDKLRIKSRTGDQDYPRHPEVWQSGEQDLAAYARRLWQWRAPWWE